MEDSKKLNLADLKEHIGEENFEAARNWAWASAPDTGTRANWEMKPNQGSGALWQVMEWATQRAATLGTDRDILHFYLDLYREFPSYSCLFDLSITRPYRELSLALRHEFWEFAREALSSESNALGDPVAFAMWCDFFEDPELVDEAWHQLVTRSIASDRLLERVLIASGPVPFRLKKPLYTLLIKRERWHYFIYRSLLHSAFDVYGKIERQEARKILGSLKLPSSVRLEKKQLEKQLASARLG